MQVAVSPSPNCLTTKYKSIYIGGCIHNHEICELKRGKNKCRAKCTEIELQMKIANSTKNQSSCKNNSQRKSSCGLIGGINLNVLGVALSTRPRMRNKVVPKFKSWIQIMKTELHNVQHCIRSSRVTQRGRQCIVSRSSNFSLQTRKRANILQSRVVLPCCFLFASCVIQHT